MVAASEHPKRRRQLMRMVGKGSIVIVPAARIKIRNNDVDYPFRQDSDFYYLSGFPEPHAVLVLVPGRTQGQYILFCRERDPDREVWDGPMAGPEGACQRYGADDAFPIGDLDDILPGLLENCERVYYTMGRDRQFDDRVVGWIDQVRRAARHGGSAPEELVSLEHLLHDMRLFKSRSELASMRRAARIAGEAHHRAMRACRPGMTEYELAAELDYVFARHGTEPAYQAIVGGGANACVLHYVLKSGTLSDGDLVLIDAGCEHDYYASDVTRTFPVNGRFDERQRAIYDVVLAAQRAAIVEVAPGKTWLDPHDAAVKAITRGLCRLGILKGPPSERIKDESYKRFFMHKTGHWLGMDVHDVGDYRVDGYWRELEPGMTMTVEPGIYIPLGAKGVAKRWQGIGVRIEDDVVVTRDGHEVLSEGIVKEPEAIERLMAEGGA